MLKQIQKNQNLSYFLILLILGFLSVLKLSYAREDINSIPSIFFQDNNLKVSQKLREEAGDLVIQAYTENKKAFEGLCFENGNTVSCKSASESKKGYCRFSPVLASTQIISPEKLLIELLSEDNIFIAQDLQMGAINSKGNPMLSIWFDSQNSGREWSLECLHVEGPHKVKVDNIKESLGGYFDFISVPSEE